MKCADRKYLLKEAQRTLDESDSTAAFCLCQRWILKDAVALLKEQEAVNPILEQDTMVCGVCGHEVVWQKMIGDGLWADEQLDYCPHCGRAVKWECPLENGGQYADQPMLREAT